jgi:hypothetical protein
MALVADLGAGVPVEHVTAHAVFALIRRPQPLPLLGSEKPPFLSDARVAPGHTYAVLLNKRHVRGLFVFTVTEYVPNERVVLRYAVKQYQLLRAEAESPGFDWERPSTQK